MMKLIKEIADVCRFFFVTPKSNKEIVFYAEHQGYYPSFEGIINELTGKHRRKICYITSDFTDPILKTSEVLIRPYYINKLLPYVMALLNVRVFVMTLTDLNQLHLRRSINPVHYVYVFHALVSTHMMYREGAFDYYDTILCVGPHQVEEIRKREEMEKLPRKNLVEAGYYRLERIYNAYQKLPKKSDSQQKTVLIAPSWGKDNVLESCGEQLINNLLQANYKVIVRPHPETVKRSLALLDLFIKKFGSNPNFVLEKSIRTDDSLLQADVLISDCSGITLEYAFGTERPVLFIDLPPKVKNPNYKNLGMEPIELKLRTRIGSILPLSKINSASQEVQRLISQTDLYRPQIQTLRAKYVYNLGHSSATGTQTILNLLQIKGLKS